MNWDNFYSYFVHFCSVNAVVDDDVDLFAVVVAADVAADVAAAVAAAVVVVAVDSVALPLVAFL